MKIVVTGDQACFTDISHRGERVTYPVITPSAARGICDGIFYHKQIRWVIDKLVILNPIIAWNEMRSELPLTDGSNAAPQLRTTQVLRNVAYGIEAHFEHTEFWNVPGRDGKPYTDGKVCGIVSRRIRKGQHQAYLGLREYAAEIEQVNEFPRSCYEGYEHDFGIMLYEPDYGQTFDKELKEYIDIPRNWYYHAVMRDGVIDVEAARKAGEVRQ